MTTPRHRRERIAAAAFVAILLAALIALILHNRQVTRELFVPLEARITPEVRLLQEYVQIDTSNPPGKEIDGARWLMTQLAKSGIKGEIIEAAPRRASVYARIRGKKAGGGLLLLSHIDVVPVANEGWSAPPFSGAIRINQLRGRGSIDMKGHTICHLEALRAVARSGYAPEHDVVFLAVADEEQGGALGTQWLLAHRPDLFEGIRYALAEGGITEMQKESLSYFGVEVGSKLNCQVDLHARTRAQLERARIALEPYFAPPKPDRVLPEVRKALADVAPLRIEQAVLLRDIDAAIAHGKYWVLPLSYRELMQNNIWAENVRAEGEGFAMLVSLLNLPDEIPQNRISWLETFVKPFGVSVEVKSVQGPVPLNNERTPLFALTTREVKRIWPNAIVGTSVLGRSMSDARFLRPRGIVCYGIQPYPVDFFQSLTVHASDERVRLDWFVSGVDLTRRIVTAYALTPSH